jgi:hypothetical protein
MIETIYQNRQGSILTLVDLNYSPDEDIYYLEQWIFDLDSEHSNKHFISEETFKNAHLAKSNFKSNRITWID